MFKANSDLRPQFACCIKTGQLNLTTLLVSHLHKIRELGGLSSLDPIHLLFSWTVISLSRCILGNYMTAKEVLSSIN